MLNFVAGFINRIAELGCAFFAQLFPNAFNFVTRFVGETFLSWSSYLYFGPWCLPTG